MKPQDFFVGVRDFFSILLPGLLILAMWPKLALAVTGRLETAFAAGGPAVVALALLAVAYGLGIVLLAVAGRLDDLVDHVLRSRRDRADDDRAGAARRKLTRWEADLYHAEFLAQELEANIIAGLRTEERSDRNTASREKRARPFSVKSFWWNYMRLRCDPGMAELDRIEGHQKLFRSLCVLSPFLIAADIPAPGRGATAAALWGWTGALGTISLWPVLLWTTAAASTLVFFWLYLRHRMRFTRRLYELAVVASLPKDQAVDLHASLFSDSGLWLRKGRNELLRKADHKTGSAPLRRR